MLVVTALAGLADVGLHRRESRADLDRRICRSKLRGIAGAIEMLCQDKHLEPRKLLWNADLVGYLNHEVYFDGGDDDCPATRARRSPRRPGARSTRSRTATPTGCTRWR